MGCRIAYPLEELRRIIVGATNDRKDGSNMACTNVRSVEELRLHAQIGGTCHDRRPGGCTQGLPEADGVLGIEGTHQGFCQGLFGPPPLEAGKSKDWTAFVKGELTSLGVPSPESHELCLCTDERPSSVDAWIDAAAAPLMEDGRTPIILTDFRVSRLACEGFFRTSPQSLAMGAVMLVRCFIADEMDVGWADVLVTELARKAVTDRAMPKLWPLFQAPEQVLARQLRERLGESWKFTAFGVNPFTSSQSIELVADQIVVGQFPVGSSNGIDTASRKIIVDHPVAGVPQGGSFSVPNFRARLDVLSNKTVRILLGPADPTWSLKTNRERVVRASELAFA